MDKILEKLGVYDLLGVLMTGICIVGITTYLLLFCRFINVTTVECIAKNVWLIVFGGYLIGIIFQELSSFLFSGIIYRNYKLLENALNLPPYDPNYIPDTQIKAVNKYVDRRLGAAKVARKNKVCKYKKCKASYNSIVYNYCRNYVKKNNAMSSFDKDQALAAMARSFCVYFILVAVLLTIDLIYKFCIKIDVIVGFYVGLFIGALLIAFLMFLRFRRFTYRRYTGIYRYFYMNKVR